MKRQNKFWDSNLSDKIISSQTCSSLNFSAVLDLCLQSAAKSHVSAPKLWATLKNCFCRLALTCLWGHYLWLRISRVSWRWTGLLSVILSSPMFWLLSAVCILWGFKPCQSHILCIHTHTHTPYPKFVQFLLWHGSHSIIKAGKRPFYRILVTFIKQLSTGYGGNVYLFTI